MNRNKIAKEQDLTPFFTDQTKAAGIITAARLVEFEDGRKEMQLAFNDAVPKVERSIRVIAVGENILNMCEEMSKEGQTPENNELLEFLDGATIKEWEN